jgi:hypothetical protein
VVLVGRCEVGGVHELAVALEVAADLFDGPGLTFGSGHTYMILKRPPECIETT